MAIHYINGHRLRRAIIAASINLIKHKDHLNNINVFPVADGDTGSNMASTMRAVLQRSYDAYEPSVAKMSTAVAESALLSARGNSGAILAQFFQGLSEGLKGKYRITVTEFSIAAQNAVDQAMDAIANPREGTILSVMKSWSESVGKLAHSEKDYCQVFKKSLDEIKIALANTPNQLPELKKAGVVDSGAEGFVNIIEGVVHLIENGSIKDEVINELESETVDISGESHIEFDPDSIHYRYCTEFLIQGDDLEKAKIRNELMVYGDSMIVAGSTTKVRVHIHTNEPEEVFKTADQYGVLLQKKAEDMLAQHSAAWEKSASDIPYGIVIDSSCDVLDIFKQKYSIRMVPLQVSIGEKDYRDKENISAHEFYSLLQRHPELSPKTSLPAPARIKQEILEALKQHDEAFVLSLSSAVSGTFQATVNVAQQIEKQFPDKKVHVFDSKSLTVTSGFLLEEIVERFEKGMTAKEIFEDQEKIRSNFNLYFYLDTIVYLQRGGRISKVMGGISNLLGLRPILTFNKNGNVEKAGVVFTRKQAIKKLLSTMDTTRKIKRIGVLHASNIQYAVELERELRRILGNIYIPTIEISPVLGSHAGPGSFGISWQYEEELGNV